MFKSIKIISTFTVLAFVGAANAREVIIELREGISPSTNFVTKVKRSFEIVGKKLYVLNEEDVTNSIRAEVKEIELNFSVSTFEKKSYEPNITDFKKQWGLQNMGANEPVGLDQMSPLKGVVGADVNITKAWTLETGKKEIIIAVIDTGVKYTHPELKSNMWVNLKEKNGRRGVDDDNNGFVDDIHGYDFVEDDGKPMDENGHGTHCSGIIGADHQVGKVAGVMKDVSIMAVRMMDKNGRGSLESSLKAVSYAIENGANILSNSWGSRNYSKILEDLLITANERGIVVVAAAGNSRFNDNDINATYPATYNSPNIISVSAFNAQDRHSSFSSFGKKTVHIAAPGTNILSSAVKKRRYKKHYKVASGTSMSAPFISGIVGLFMSRHGSKFTPVEIKEQIVNTATPVEHIKDMNQAGGRVNAFRFLNQEVK